MKPPLSLVPLLPVTAAFVAGVAGGLGGASLWWSLVPVVVSVALALAGHRYYAAIAVAAALGFADSWLQNDSDAALRTGIGDRLIEATALDVRESDASRTIEVNITAAGNDSTDIAPISHTKAIVVIPSFLPDIQTGQRVVMRCDLSSRNFIEYVPGQFDYGKVLARRGIHITGIARPDDIYEIADSHTASAAFASARSRITASIMQSRLSPGAKEFLNTTITGDSSALDDTTRATFADAGIAHVLALSGLHVGILSLFVSLMLLPLVFNTATRKAIPLILAVVLWLFAFVTGMSPSVTRAVIMATALIAASMLQRRHSSYNSQCLAALVILIFDPFALLSVSFQLSFAAVAGILAFSKALNPVSPRRRIAYSICGMFTVSIGAMLATGLLSAFYFHKFPAYFLIANVLATPLLLPLVGGGFALVVFNALGIEASWLCDILNLLYTAVENIAVFASRLPGAGSDNLYISAGALACGAGTTLLLALALHFRRRIYTISCAICAIATVFLITATPHAEAAGVYIMPSTYRTDIVVSTPDTLHIITRSNHREHDKIARSARISLGNYMLLRGIDSISVTNSGMNAGGISYNHPALVTPGASVLIADGSTRINATQSRGFTYLLVCRGQIADITGLTQCADTVLLSADLHPRRHERYAEQCVAAGVPYISLKERSPGNLLSVH